MAICKFGTTVVGVRGTIGGLTYSANATGPYVRTWSKGANPRTLNQSRNRGRIAGLGIGWALLTDNDRDAWDTFGQNAPEIDTNSLGEVITLGGWQWYVRVNKRRQSVGLAITDSVPSTDPVPPLNAVILDVIDFPVTDITIEHGAGEVPAGHSIVSHIAVARTVTLRNKFTGAVQLLALHEPVSEVNSIMLNYLAAFGTPHMLTKIFSHNYLLRDDGVRSIDCPDATIVPVS